jgi:UDPglucose 6-dehydrogenase
LCEKTGADVDEVAKAVGMDSRIVPKFLKASFGFGGCCFQKDILNLVYMAKSFGLHEVDYYWKQVFIMNDHQKRSFSANIVKTLFNTFSGKKKAILGWAFKKDTKNTRESASIYLADYLLNEQVEVVVYDPKVTAKQIYFDLDYLGRRNEKENQKQVQVLNEPYESCQEAHAIAVLKEWDDFKAYHWGKIYDYILKPAFVFERRNIPDVQELTGLGLVVDSVDHPTIYRKEKKPVAV